MLRSQRLQVPSVTPPKTVGLASIKQSSNLWPWIPIFDISRGTVDVGDGYNMVSHEVYPSQLLTDQGRKGLRKEPLSHTKSDFILHIEESTAVEKLDVSAHLKLSILSGLISVGGSGNYLKETHNSTKQVSLTVLIETFSEDVSLAEQTEATWQIPLLKEQFQKEAITHVVGKVVRGAKMSLTLTQKLSEQEEASSVRGSLNVVAKWLAGEITGEGKVEVSDENKKLCDSVSIHVESDSQEQIIATNVIEAIKQVKGILPRLTERTVKFQLVPISDIIHTENKIMYEINDDLVADAADRLRKLGALTARSDEIKDKYKHLGDAFSHKLSLLNDLARTLANEKLAFTSNLQHELKGIRYCGNTAAVSSLASLISQYNIIDYTSAHEWLDYRERELRQLDGWIRFLTSGNAPYFAPENLVSNGKPFSARNIHFDPSPSAEPALQLIFALGTNIDFDEHTFLEDSTLKFKDWKDDEWLYSDESSQDDNEDDDDDGCNESILFKANAVLKEFLSFASRNATFQTDKHQVEFIAERRIPERGQAKKFDLKNPGVFLRNPNGKIKPFIIPSPPKSPAPTVVRTDAKDGGCIELNFPSNQYFADPLTTSYTVRCYQPLFEREHLRKVLAPDCDDANRDSFSGKGTFTGLSADSEYEISVRVETKIGHTEFGPSIKVKTDPVPPICCSDDFLESCTPVKTVDGKGTFYLLPLVEDQTRRRHKPATKTVPECSVRWKTVRLPPAFVNPNAADVFLLLVGATGVGKSTMLDAIANTALNVRASCLHRFTFVPEVPMEKQAHSVTSEITVYEIPAIISGRFSDYNIYIIDCPGANDTRGLKYDEALKHMFSMLYEDLHQLHLACFLASGTEFRIGPVGKYIVQQTTAVFGNDFREHFGLILTKSDFGAKPKAVIDAVSTLIGGDTPLPSSRVFPTNNTPFMMYPDDNPNLTAPLFDTSTACCTKLLFEAIRAGPATTEKSKATVNARLDMTRTYAALSRGLDNQCKILQQIVDALKAAKTVDFKKPKPMKKRRATEVTHRHACVTVCISCLANCHTPCYLGPETDKIHCAMINKQTGKCKGCNCDVSYHFNKPFYYDNPQEVEETDTGLMLKFSGYVKVHCQKERAIAGMFREYLNAIRGIREVVDEMHSTHNNLRALALNPHVLTSAEFVKQLRAQTEQLKLPNWDVKLRELDRIIQQEKIAEDLGQERSKEEQAAFEKKLEKVIQEIMRVSNATEHDFELLRDRECEYSWCGTPCKWPDAVAQLIDYLQHIIAGSQGANQNVEKKSFFSSIFS